MLYHWTTLLPTGPVAMVELSKQSTFHVCKASELSRISEKGAALPPLEREVGLQLVTSQHCC